jgi:hypothetical protein
MTTTLTRLRTGAVLAGTVFAVLLAGCGSDADTGERAAAPASAPVVTTAAPSAASSSTAVDRTGQVVSAVRAAMTAGFTLTIGSAGDVVTGVYDPGNGGMGLEADQNAIMIIGIDLWAQVESTTYLHYTVLNFKAGQNVLGLAFPPALLQYALLTERCVAPGATAPCAGEFDLDKAAGTGTPASTKLATILRGMSEQSRVPITVTLDGAGRLASIQVKLKVDKGPDTTTLTITGPSQARVAKPGGRIVEAPPDAY